MSVYKDEQRGTWYCMFRYNDWTGKQKQKCKRGFKTKREAKEYEEQFIHTTEADMNMKLGAFVEIYFRDKQGELKERSVKNKRYMIERHILPYFEQKSMNEITPADIIQWQNKMRDAGYSQTYLRMLQNQMTALLRMLPTFTILLTIPVKRLRKWESQMRIKWIFGHMRSIRNSSIPLKWGADIMCCLRFCSGLVCV